MPVVPKKEIGSIRNAPIPSVYQSSDGATPDAFGMLQAKATQSTGAAIGNVADALHKHALEMKEENDLLKVQETLVTAKDEARAALDEGDDAIFSRTGSRALGATDEAKKLFEDTGHRYGDKLTPAQRKRFVTAWQRERDGTLDRVASYEADQRKVYMRETGQAMAENFRRDALRDFDDPAAVNRAMEKSAIVVRTWSERAGDPPEETTNKVAETKSGILSGVIGRIALEDSRAAETMLRERMDDLVPEHAVAVERSIRSERTRQDRALMASVSDAVHVLEQGRTPPGLTTLQDATRGTEAGKMLADAVDDREAVSEFLEKPMADQAAEIRRLATAGTTDRRTLDLQNRLARAHASLGKEIADGNGLVAARDLGVIDDLAGIDLSQPMTLSRRASQASMASRHFGVPVEPILPAEVEAIADQIKKAPADQVVGILSALSDGLGEDGARAFVTKSPEVGVAVSILGHDPALARDIVLGARLFKQNPDVRPAKMDREPVAADVFSNMFDGLPGAAQMRAPYIAAAESLYAARRVPTGDMAFDADTYEQALRDVMGQPFRFNGRTVLPPVPDADEDRFADIVRGLTPQDMVFLGNGKPVFADGTPFEPSMFHGRIFGPEAQMVSAGAGNYLIQFPGLGFVTTPSGEPYVINLAREF